MHKKLSIIVFSILLSGCSYFHIYQPDIQQGNILEQKQVAQIKPGMSEYAVQHILGQPVLTDVFTKNQIIYIYTMKPNHEKMTQKKLMLTFSNGKLVKIEKNEI